MNLQETNRVLAFAGKTLLLFLGALVGQKMILDTLFQNFRKPIQNYISTKERVVTPESATFFENSEQLPTKPKKDLENFKVYLRILGR